jgi:hypothetical protein
MRDGEPPADHMIGQPEVRPRHPPDQPLGAGFELVLTAVQDWFNLAYGSIPRVDRTGEPGWQS